MSDSPTDDPELIRYLDWCSAQVARRFLSLSAEEVWGLAQRGPEPASGTLRYPETVQRIALVLFRELELPDFEEWRAAYRADPERYQRETAALLDPAEPPSTATGAGSE